MKVLAIDDSKVALLLVEKVLKEAVSGSVEVVKEQDPVKGVEIALEKANEWDFVFVDFNMPTLSGIEVIDRIIGSIDPKKIALLTANSQSLIRDEAKKRGVHFFSKDDLRGALPNTLKDMLKAG